MPEDDAGQVEAPTMDVETTETPTEGFITEDGSFVPGWQTKLSDTSLHDDLTLRTFKNIEGLAKSYVHVRKQVPLNKIAIPNEKSPQLEWDEFYRAGGRPETPQDYNLQVPEDLPEGVYTKDRLEQAQQLFHKLGISSRQAQALMEYDQGIARQYLQDFEQQQLVDRENAKNELLQLWGNAYEQRVHFGNVAVNEGVMGDSELQARITEKFGDDPDFIRLLSNLGAKFTERGAIHAENVPTPMDYEQQIQDAMANPAYHADYLQKGYTRAQHDKQVALVTKLIEMKGKMSRTG